MGILFISYIYLFLMFEAQHYLVNLSLKKAETKMYNLILLLLFLFGVGVN